MLQDDKIEGANLAEEVLNQKEKVVARLMQNISKLSNDIEVDYLKLKWNQDPDGSRHLSPEELTVETCVRLHQNSNHFDELVDHLKIQQAQTQALVATKLKKLESTK